jgi:hypothetical protein
MPKTLEATTEGARIVLRMTGPTAQTLVLGTRQYTKAVVMTRRMRFFFEAFTAELEKAIDEAQREGVFEDMLPLAGEAILLEEEEDGQLTMPTEPVLFIGRWALRRIVDGLPLAPPVEHRLTAKTVWEFVQKAKAKLLPLPPGCIDWLRASPLEGEAAFDTPTYYVVFNTTRRDA